MQEGVLGPGVDPSPRGPRPPRERLAEAAVQLADFRRRQGRFPEARRLLNQAGDTPAARLVEAAMTLDRGDAPAATDLSERLLGDVPRDDPAARARVLEVLGVAAASKGDLVTGRGAAAELRSIADADPTDELIALAAFVGGVIAFESGDLGRRPAAPPARGPPVPERRRRLRDGPRAALAQPDAPRPGRAVPPPNRRRCRPSSCTARSPRGWASARGGRRWGRRAGTRPAVHPSRRSANL